MTNREFYTAVVKTCTNKEVQEFATNAILKLDERNKARAAKPSTKAVENAPIKESILDYLSKHEKGIASEIGASCGVSTNKASALCIQLVNEGKVKQSEVKIKGKGKVKGYALIAEEEGE